MAISQHMYSAWDKVGAQKVLAVKEGEREGKREARKRKKSEKAVNSVRSA